jgi:hypothetical protein
MPNVVDIGRGGDYGSLVKEPRNFYIDRKAWGNGSLAGPSSFDTAPKTGPTQDDYGWCLPTSFCAAL